MWAGKWQRTERANVVVGAFGGRGGGRGAVLRKGMGVLWGLKGAAGKQRSIAVVWACLEESRRENCGFAVVCGSLRQQSAGALRSQFHERRCARFSAD